MNEEFRYKINVVGGTAYIWVPGTNVGIAPSLEEWEKIKEIVDRQKVPANERIVA